MKQIILIALVLTIVASSFSQENIALGKQATSSGTYRNYYPGLAVDGNYSTYWNSGMFAKSEGTWLKIDLGDDYQITEIEYSIQMSTSGNVKLDVWGITSDGIGRPLGNWSELWCTNGQVIKYPVVNKGGFRQVKINFYKSPSWIALNEVKIYGMKWAAAREASKTPEQKAEDLVKSGDQKSDNKDYPGAIADFTKAIGFAPGNHKAYLGRGIAKVRSQDYSGAISDLNASLEKRPDERLAYFFLGYAKGNLGDYAAAKIDLDSFLKEGCWSVFCKLAYYSRGIVSLKLGQKKCGCLDLRIAQHFSADNQETVNKYCDSSIYQTVTRSYTASSQPGTVADIDGNVYHTIKIGKQEWMIENLQTNHFQDGSPIWYLEDNFIWSGYCSESAYCWYDNNVKYKNRFGALYNWFAVSDPKNICPDGWHVPSDKEWRRLIDDLGNALSAADKMREGVIESWKNIFSSAATSSSFSALPGGFRSDDGAFSGLGNKGTWWTFDEEDEDYGISRFLDNNVKEVVRGKDYKNIGQSVRCVKD